LAFEITAPAGLSTASLGCGDARISNDGVPVLNRLLGLVGSPSGG
jgi:hypothetical protein